jgi:hypothetical protein
VMTLTAKPIESFILDGTEISVINTDTVKVSIINTKKRNIH